MDEQKKTSGSLALNSTPQVITIPPSDPVRVRKLRVAAYARVSSSSEDQLNSFVAQNAHYTELITDNPEWEFVDVYADKHRPFSISSHILVDVLRRKSLSITP